jgi:P-aminobenzoate N-oxygenase AurF
MTDPAAAARSLAANGYRSRFTGWYERASVRVKPRRVLEPGSGDQVYFPPEHLPILAHPIVTERGAPLSHFLQVQRLYQYLHFTTELELYAVCPVASGISRHRVGLEVPEAARRDAFKIVTDEAWHAQFSYDLMRQIEAETGIAVPELAAPPFVAMLDDVTERLSPALRGAELTLFAVVSETLITALLAALPHDRRLPAAVREVVRDHAEDEGRHHAYFRYFLELLWNSLDTAQRRDIGPRLPEIIDAFLVPDYRALARSLMDGGLSVSDAEQVLAESYPDSVTESARAVAAAPTVRYFTEVGALAEPATREAFAAAKLLPT